MKPADYVGVPFVDRGRDPTTGLDCWGLVCWWYAVELGLVLPTLTDAPSGEHDTEHLPALIQTQARAWRKVSVPERGDVVVVRIAGQPFHVAVYAGLINGEPSLLHALKGVGVHYSPFNSPMWTPRIEGIYRHRSRA